MDARALAAPAAAAAAGVAVAVLVMGGAQSSSVPWSSVPRSSFIVGMGGAVAVVGALLLHRRSRQREREEGTGEHVAVTEERTAEAGAEVVGDAPHNIDK